MRTHNFFNFFPVGQGLFYCGLINEGQYSFVYDCGTETAGVNIKTYIAFLQKWNGHRKLDFVAISHFHRDHINGIKELEKMIGFKKIYLPYICDNELARMFLIGMSFFNVLEAENDSLNEIAEADNALFETYSYFLNLYLRDDAVTFKTYQNINIHNWEFRFFNKPIPKPKELQLVLEINSLIKGAGASDVIDLFRYHKFDDIKKIYHKVFGSHHLNDTSLVLLHYPALNGITPTTAFYPNIHGLSMRKTLYHYFYPYSLLTGDILLDVSFSKTIISYYPTGISGFVQVPHHGSKNNWPPLIINFKTFNCFIIPFGTTNHYGHPDAALKHHIKSTDYFEVNEYSGFPYWIYN